MHNNSPAGERQPELKHKLLDDRYELLETLGQGSFGTVYLAFDRQLGRAVAIKVLHLSAAMTQDFARVRGRLVREAQALSSLSHPGLVQVYRLGFVDESGPFIVMEYVQGESLSAALLRDGPFSSREATALCIQIAAALQHAHAQGIVHRDIKPTNILLERTGSERRARLVDFGLSSISGGDREDLARLTVTGSFLGTPEYASPEQFRGETVDARADIYALGLVFFEMLAGKPAYDMELREAVSKPLPDLVRADPSAQLPPLLQDILNKATQRDKNERYSSVAELLSDLQTLLPKCGDRKFTTARLQPERKRDLSKTIFFVGIVGAVVISLGMLVAMYRDKSARVTPASSTGASARPHPVAKAQPNTAHADVDEPMITGQFATYLLHDNASARILETYNTRCEDAIDTAIHATNPQEQARLFDKAGMVASKFLAEARAMRGQKHICFALQQLARVYELTHRTRDAIPLRANAEEEFKPYLKQAKGNERDNCACYRIGNLCSLSDDCLPVDLAQATKWLEVAVQAAQHDRVIENGDLGLLVSRQVYDRCEHLGDLLYSRGDPEQALKFYKLQQQFLSTQKESRQTLTRVTGKIAHFSEHP